MSRPICLLLVVVPALVAPLAGCSSPYRRMYSPAKSYYKAPPEVAASDVDKLPPAPAEGQVSPSMPVGTPPGELPPVPPEPPAAMPAADPLNMAPPAPL
jgi:hypothetical protein